MGAAAHQGGGNEGNYHHASATKAKLTLAGQLDCGEGWPAQLPFGWPVQILRPMQLG